MLRRITGLRASAASAVATAATAETVGAAPAALLSAAAAARLAARPARGTASSSTTTTTTDPAAHRARVLALFRAILREARGMPTQNRRDYVVKRARAEFGEGAAAATRDEADFLVRLAETQLENVQVQRRLLTELQRKGQLKS
jgi:hypothetical protein